MHEMGSVREVDQTLARALMAEFVRLQLIVGEDFTKSLLALHSDLETSCEVLMSDIVRTIYLHPNDPAAHQVKAALQKFQQSTSLNPAPDGAGGSLWRHGGVHAEPPLRTKLAN